MRLLGSVRARILLMVIAVVLAAVIAVGWTSRRVTRSEFRQFVAKLETDIEGGEPSAESALLSGLESLGDRVQQAYHRDGDWSGAGETLAAAGDSEELRGRAALVVVDGSAIAAASDETLHRAEVSVTEGGALELSGWHVVDIDGVFDDQAVAFRGPHRVIRDQQGGEAGVLYLLPLPRDEDMRRVVDVVHEEDFFDALDRWMIFVVIGIGLAALGAAVVLSGRILGPVGKLTEAARRMGGGELGLRVDVDSRDEIGELAEAFNTMAASIERNEKLRRDMVSDVAHELRTPLTNLRGQLEAVQDGLVAPSAELVASLHEETMLLSRLVDDLQELALADAGQLRLQLEEVDVAAEIERAAAAFRPAERPQDQPVAIDLALGRPHDLPAVRADRQRLRQVLSNLIDNAIRHGGGRVRIAARAEARAPDTALSPPPAQCGFVQVTVADSGPGVAAERPADVFERFYRTDPSRQRATGGAGLGLAIVRQLVEAQGGCVWVASEPGAGATFGFCLPVAGPEND